MTTEKRWAIIIKTDGHISTWACDETGHLRKGEWLDPEDICLIATIMDVAPPDGTRRKQKGLYLLANKNNGRCNADVNTIATKMTSGWVTIPIYGNAILMDAEGEGKPIGLPWDEAAYIIEQWKGGKQG